MMKINGGEGVEKLECHCWWDYKKNGVVTVENSLEVPQKLKKSYSMTHQFHSWAYIENRFSTQNLYIDNSKRQKEPKCSSTDEHTS
jgi:hypothetical protein